MSERAISRDKKTLEVLISWVDQLSFQGVHRQYDIMWGKVGGEIDLEEGDTGHVFAAGSMLSGFLPITPLDLSASCPPD